MAQGYPPVSVCPDSAVELLDFYQIGGMCWSIAYLSVSMSKKKKKKIIALHEVTVVNCSFFPLDIILKPV